MRGHQQHCIQGSGLEVLKYQITNQPLRKTNSYQGGQIKHTKNFSIKNFGAPKTPPLEIFYVWVFSCVLKRKEAPNIKNLRGSGVPWRGGLVGNGQVSLIFGVPNFCAFSFLVLCRFKLQVEAKKRQKLGTPKIGDTWPFPI